MSERTVKRSAKRQNLFRRKRKCDLKDAALFIQENIANSGQLHGYRWMYSNCMKAGYNVTQESARLLLKIFDGVERRKDFVSAVTTAKVLTICGIYGRL